nr:hypothetical protein CFP56_13287 [Quercus suber]
MAPVQIIHPHTYNTTSTASPVAYNVTSVADPSSDNTTSMVDLSTYNATSDDMTTCTLVDPIDASLTSDPYLSRHWKMLHMWLPLGLLALLALLFLLWALHLWHRLRRAQRRLYDAEARTEELEDAEAGRLSSGTGSSGVPPAAMIEKVSDSPVVTVTPATNGNNSEVVVTSTVSGAPGTMSAGAGSNMNGSGSASGQTLAAPSGAGGQSGSAASISSSPVNSANGESATNGSQGTTTVTGAQSSDPRAAGTLSGHTSTVTEQPRTVTETPGLVVREAPTFIYLRFMKPSRFSQFTDPVHMNHVMALVTIGITPPSMGPRGTSQVPRRDQRRRASGMGQDKAELPLGYGRYVST